jgi:hypothetical protein
MIGTLAISAVVATAAVIAVDRVRRKARREQYIRTFMFPRGVFDKLLAARPGLAPKDLQLVARALRQFFLTYHKSGYQRVAMPSQVVDDLWHEFILFTRDYQVFCRTAFGNFLHHTPAVKMGDVKTDNEGLRRVWWFSCLEENINPRKATRLPLLFAIDRKLGIENGFVYDLDCRRSPAAAASAATIVATTQCATDFGDRSIDGTLAGLGASGEDPNRTGSACGGGGSSCGGTGTHGGSDGGGADGGGSGCSGGCSGGCGGGS